MCLAHVCFGGQTESIYKKIQHINLASLSWEDEEWPNESFRDYLYRCLSYQTNLQEIKKRRIVFNLFDKLSADTFASHNVLYDMITLQDLELLAGKRDGQSHLGHLIDRTSTELGRVFLYGLISSPITDISVLQARQDIIKYLIAHEDFYAKITMLYKRLARSENMILSLYAQDGFVHSTQRHYFSLPFMRSNESLNHFPIALELKSLWDHQLRGVALISGMVAAVLLPVYALSMITDIQLPVFLQTMAQNLQGSCGRVVALLACGSSNRLVTSSMAALAGVLCGLGCKEEYEWFRDNFVLDECLQKKMISVARFFNTITKLDALLVHDADFMKLSPAAHRLHHLIHKELRDPRVQELFQFFGSSTLQGAPFIFAYQGRVLAAFKLLYEMKEKFEPLLMTLGELDAYRSCAYLYKEFEHARVRFCFTDYKSNEQPCIIFHQFWNPFVSTDSVVSNTIELCGPHARNLVITGPNAGGKSTLIKAIPINLILSQSIGLAAASYAQITPFYSIATYLNIIDDIAAGNSLFKAQVLRAQEMINAVEQAHAKNGFSFIALDEMFNGTSAKESMAIAYSVVKHIGSFRNTMSLIATHFPLLTTLEAQDPAFVNYKVSVKVDERLGIQYPFTLKKGASNQHIALDILRQEGYDLAIVSRASEILNLCTDA